jgi:putative membrane protein
MPKQRLKAWLPTPEKLHQNRIVRWFAPFLADARLWHMNRNSLGKAVYIGVLCAFFPLPGQMPLAIIGALLFRANVPMAIALTWLTNPLTTIPIFWAAYCVGAFLLGEPLIGFRTVGVFVSELTKWLSGNGYNAHILTQFSLPAFGLGLVIFAIVTSIIAGILFRIVWQYYILIDWRKRHGYNADAPKFSNQKNRKSDDDFSI